MKGRAGAQALVTSMFRNRRWTSSTPALNPKIFFAEVRAVHLFTHPQGQPPSSRPRDVQINLASIFWMNGKLALSVGSRELVEPLELSLNLRAVFREEFTDLIAQFEQSVRIELLEPVCPFHSVLNGRSALVCLRPESQLPDRAARIAGRERARPGRRVRG